MLSFSPVRLCRGSSLAPSCAATTYEGRAGLTPFDVARYEELHHGGIVGSAVHHYERTTSTMDEARAGAQARGGEGCGDAYVADEQTAGRGRFRRPWADAPGASLLVTFHLCVREVEYLPFAVFAGALATADAVAEVSGLETALKWPNDVLAGGRKLAGILAEARAGSTEADVFLGIGVNIGEAAIAGLPAAERAARDEHRGRGRAASTGRGAAGAAVRAARGARRAGGERPRRTAGGLASAPRDARGARPAFDDRRRRPRARRST